MKLKILSVFASLLLLISCGGSRTATSTSTNQAYDVPAPVHTSFTTQYPTAGNVVWSAYDAATVPVDWELNGWTVLGPTDYAVTFDLDGNKYYSWYDVNGNWVGSSYVVAENRLLPSAIQSAITSRYPGYTIDKIQRESWKDRTAYEVKLQNGDNKVKMLIDDNGNVIKEKNKW